MLRGRVVRFSALQCRQYTDSHGSRSVPVLHDALLHTFRKEAFEPATPALLPRKHFAELPAIDKWFTRPSKSGRLTLNTAYLSKYGATIVPLEILHNDEFARIQQSLSFFLECVQASSSQYVKPLAAKQATRGSTFFSAYVPGTRSMKRTRRSNDFFSSSASTPSAASESSAAPMSTPTARVYLAQAAIADLPRAMALDIPTPEIVLQAGKGDVYDSSIWLGQAPTYTPLHRDPNPNLFVQLAGKKIVRLFRPQVGQGIFAKVQENIGGSASATLRGEEMMLGMEKKVLEEEVWGEESASVKDCWEAELHSGDGLFIPKGWWHSVKGVGKGMTGSVNWWFR